MTNCPPVYQNVQCESFGNKKKITSNLLRQFCKNDSYLYEQIQQLWDMTDPEVRKRFYPPDFMDVSHSYGIESHIISQYDEEFFQYWNTVYRFSTIDRYKYTFDFNNANDSISEIKNDSDDIQYVEINGDSFLDLENNYNEVNLEIVKDSSFSTLRPPLQTGSYKEIIHHNAEYTTCKKKISVDSTKPQYVIQRKEKLGKAKKDAHFYGAYNNWDCNNHWYNGFNRTKNYNVKAKWKKDQDSYDIPSVCHAQTFKAQNNGRVNKVSLNIQGSKSAVSPCIVEIRTTKNGKPTTKVLARTERKFSGGGENIVAFTFKTKAKVVKGKTYAIVVRSPLSKFENCYRLGGWTTGCFSSESKYYGDGSAFLSEDNGKTWIKNGKTSDKKSYGSHYYDWGINQKPIDFAFEVYVEPVTIVAVKTKVKQKTKETKYVSYKKLVKKAYNEKHTYEYNYFKEGSYYVHLKPIQCNPIDNFIISNTYCDKDGNIVGDGDDYWTWEYYNPYTSKWEEVTNNIVDLDNNRTNYVVLKLRLRCDITSNTLGEVLSRDGVSNFDKSIANTLIVTTNKLKETALTFVKEAKLTINCRKPDKAYLRTQYYHPERDSMLGANIWSEIGLKAKTLKKGNVEIDIIHEKEAIEHFHFYDLGLIENYDSTKDYRNGGNIIYDEKTIETFDSLSDLIKEYTNNNNFNIRTGIQVIDYIYEDFNGDKGFITLLQNQLTPIYLLPVTYLINNEEKVINFFEEIQLPHLPAYPLVAGDVGEEDIIINTENIVGGSEYGAYYPLNKNIAKTINSIYVSYNVYTDIDTVTTTDDEGEDVELALDDDGFEINQSESQERVVETLNGIILGTNDVFTTQNTIRSNIIDGQNMESTIDYAITKNGKYVIFNLASPIIQTIFPNYQSDDFTLTDHIGTENVTDFELKIDLINKSYQEFVDFEVDYDKGTLQFYNPLNLIDGDFKVSYNPLWVRGLSIEDFPLQMDLWKEKFLITTDGIYKLKFNTTTLQWDRDEDRFYEKTNINPLSNEKGNAKFYTFRTTVPPLDNIRKLVINEENADGGKQLVEDTQYFVNYLNNQIVIYKTTENPNISDLKDGDILTIHYTPNLTDDGLALGYRLKRPRYELNDMEADEDSEDYISKSVKNEDDIYIGMNYFTYRV